MVWTVSAPWLAPCPPVWEGYLTDASSGIRCRAHPSRSSCRGWAAVPWAAEVSSPYPPSEESLSKGMVVGWAKLLHRVAHCQSVAVQTVGLCLSQHETLTEVRCLLSARQRCMTTRQTRC